nr:non-canonical purine NTP pyrophosphatase [Haloplasma contractile]
MAFVIPNKNPIVVEGRLDGIISIEPKGTKGFGYDPLFYIPQLKKHAAELSQEEKSAISHRGNALRELKTHLEKMLDEK